MARTDGDSWDLASSVGATATGVAAQRVLATRQHLIDDPFAEPLVRAVGMDFFIRMLDDEITYDNDDPLMNPARMAEGMAVRTRYFDDFFIAATDAGLRQAVILASGLDARAYRLPWPAGMVVYEVDQPQVVEFKSRTLAGIGARPTAEHRVVAMDLRDDWPTALRNNGFDVSQPTAWIAEGLLVYLPPDAQDRLFDNINSLSAPGSRLATEHVPDMAVFSDERAKELTQQWRQQGYDVDMTELIYPGERNHVTEYLATRGWDVATQGIPELYAANGFSYPESEALAAFAEVKYLSATLR